MEAQIRGTGMATDLCGANTLCRVCSRCLLSGERVGSGWAGWGGPSPALGELARGAWGVPTASGGRWARPCCATAASALAQIPSSIT